MRCSKYIIYDKKKLVHKPFLGGGKAVNLAKLANAGFAVPDFIVVSTKAFADKRAAEKKAFIVCLKKKLAFITAQNGDAFAVRSSAEFEDAAGQSFAGQLQSFLGLRGAEDILKAVHKVWASAGKEHVERYIGTPTKAPRYGVAVIVQRMIAARFSGVLFTAHPVTNDPDVMLLEIVEGGCENLVSGKTTPVHISINKRDFSLHIESTSFSIPVRKFIKDPENMRALADLAVQVENLFSAPQDIEWAYDGRFWLLQSRPITTFGTHRARIHIDRNTVEWTDYFFAERFTESVSPLGWSFLGPVIARNAFWAPLCYLGYAQEFKGKRMLTVIDGMPHARLAAFQRLYSVVPSGLISADKKQALRLEHTFSFQRLLKRLPSVFFRLLFNNPNWLPLYNLYRWREFNRSLEQRLAARRQKVAMDDLSENMQFVKDMQAFSDEFLSIHSWSITFADIFYALLKRLVSVIDADSVDGIDKLLGGLQGNETIQANIDLYTCNTGDKASLNKFLKKYGHRSKSLDIASPTWEENYDMLKKVAAMLKKSKPSPLQSLQKSREAREKEEQRLHNKIGQMPLPLNILLLAIFKLILYFARQFILLRENQRNAWHKILARTRKACLRMGVRLQKEGRIAAADDIFYFHLHELNALSDGVGSSAVDKAAARKKAAKSKDSAAFETNYAKGKKLFGIGVSSGLAKGRARICKTYQDVLQAQGGDILVVPSADPAWSPVFNIAAGMIMETGGVLSHASIVAREFHLPTVTNIKNATKMLHDGDQLELDGAAGSVAILS